MTIKKEKKRVQSKKTVPSEKKFKESAEMEGEVSEQEPLSPQQQKIAKWLKKVRFQKCFIGGVSEADVWKKISELHAMYEVALAYERGKRDLAAESEQSPKEEAGDE